MYLLLFRIFGTFKPIKTNMKKSDLQIVNFCIHQLITESHAKLYQYKNSEFSSFTGRNLRLLYAGKQLNQALKLITFVYLRVQFLSVLALMSATSTSR
jgi:hypothetical protein